MSRCTVLFCSFIKTSVLLAATALTAVSTAPVLAASGDPFQILYIFPGVFDNGGAAGVGVATVVHCFNFSGTPEVIQYVAKDWNGTVKANLTYNVVDQQTATVTTHNTNLYTEDLGLNTGAITQGALGIRATTTNIVCTAQVVDAAPDVVPNGIDLHPLRLNPMPGTDE